MFYVLAVIGAFASACSLIIPFDDYRGPGGDASEAAVDGGLNDAEEASCEASDKTDPNNCGTCGRVCVEGTCDAGRCPITSLFDGDGGAVQALTVAPHADAGAYLYFSTAGTFVARRSLESGVIEMAPTAVASGAARALSVNADASLGVAAVGVRAIQSFDPADFADRALQPLSTSHTGLGPLLLSGDHVFWGDDAGAWWSDTMPDAAATGGPDAGSAPPVAFAELIGAVLWVTADGVVYSIDSRNPAAVTRLLEAGGTAATFADIAASKRYLYLCQKTSVGGGVIVYSLANLAAPLRTIAIEDPQAVVTDGEFVYIVDYKGKLQGDSRLVRTRADGTGLIVLADSLRNSRGLAVEAPWVYFADGPVVLRTSR